MQKTTSTPGATVPSPCRNLCKLDVERRWCTGCWRSLNEITTWSKLSNAQKQAVWQALPDRQRAAETGAAA